MEYRTYSVSRRDREPLLDFIVQGLQAEGCRLIFCSSPAEAPFRLTFETAAGERMGIVVYAFLANSRLTRNRPDDECRFQVKYGADDKQVHSLWQDSYGLYTTLFLGINPAEGFFVAADPVLHSPTRFFKSIEFKHRHVEESLAKGWSAWERERRRQVAEPAEVLVGGKQEMLLRLIRFEREALGEDPGHRQLLAERFAMVAPQPSSSEEVQPQLEPNANRLHSLAQEFELSEAEVLDLIASARRLKMAVRGWVAEEHLVRRLQTVPGVTNCVRLDEEGGPDIRLQFERCEPITIECKNVLRQRSSAGLARLDFQRTRASKEDPCSRYYSPKDFDVVAACLHSVTERWEFCYTTTAGLRPHTKCAGKIANNLLVDEVWTSDAATVLRAVSSGCGQP